MDDIRETIDQYYVIAESNQCDDIQGEPENAHFTPSGSVCDRCDRANTENCPVFKCKLEQAKFLGEHPEIVPYVTKATRVAARSLEFTEPLELSIPRGDQTRHF